MKQYRITVNGVSYDVVVEETASIPTAPVAAPVAPVAPAAAPAAAPAPVAAPVAAGATAVKAPMPGTINAIRVNTGDVVKKGDVLAVLEAMKMENDICAPADGVVASINVTQGATVKPDQVILTLN